MLLGKIVLKICNKFTGEHPCRKVISIMLQGNFIEIKLRQGFFCKAGSGRLLLMIQFNKTEFHLIQFIVI